MSITINGSGSITGISTGGLPNDCVANADLEYAGTDGQVLTSTGATTAPAWEDLPTTAAGYTWTSMQTFSGSNSVEISGIPDGTNRIVVVLNKVTWAISHNNAMQFNVGQASIDTGNNYTWAVSNGTGQNQQTSATSYMRVLPSGYASGTNTMTGQIFITRLTTNMFVINGLIGDVVNGNVSVQSNGVYEGGDEVNRIRFTCNSGNYDGGRMIVGYA